MHRRTLLAAGLTAPALARAQSGPIRIVVPFPPGGSVDTIARLLQPHLTASLGAPVIVENRAGASGSLGTAAVARAAPDGQTWVFVFDTHAVNPALIPNMGFDTRRDLAPVLLIGTAPMLITTHRDRPLRSFADLLAAARAKPDTITYGSIGNGSLAHLTMALVERAAGIRLVHVPYRGGGPLVVAATSNEVELPVATASVFAALIGAGTLRPLASTGPRRSAAAPDVPTLRELGLAVEAEAFWGVLTAAATPAPLIARMQGALRAAFADPTVRQRVEGTMGIDLALGDGPSFAAFLDTQLTTWARVVRDNDIRPD